MKLGHFKNIHIYLFSYFHYFAVVGCSLTNELSCHGPVPPETCIIMNRQQALTTCYDRHAVTWKVLKVKKLCFWENLLVEQGHG